MRRVPHPVTPCVEKVDTDYSIRVLLADDHALVRAGIRRVLEESGNMFVVGEAANGTDAVRLASCLKPNVVILDISMPGMDGADTVAQFHSVIPRINILIVTMHPEEHFALRMMKAGCQGYITKDVSPQELRDAVRVVASGQQYLSPRGKDVLTSQIVSANAIPGAACLSDREVQVLCLLAQGLKLKEVAEHLDLSVRTIETYALRLRQKLGLRNKVEISRFAYQNRLI